MNGYQSEIFELHDVPGGLCTAWERKGYVFDGCIHYLFGSGENQPFNQVWKELGVLQNRTFIDHEVFMHIVDPDGQRLIAYCDPDRLEAHLKEISPQDAKLIEDFTAGVRKFKDFDMAAMQSRPRHLFSAENWAELGKKMTPFLGSLMKWGRLSAEEFAQQFKHPFLQRAIPQIFGWTDIPVMVGMSLLAYMDNKNAGFPRGASLAFARDLEQRYLDLGGVIHYKSQVEKILVEEEKAVGVRLYNDQIHTADRVISACDGRGTIFNLLDGAFTDRKIEQLYDGQLPMHTQVQISLGIARDFSNEPHWVTYLLDEPLLIAGEERHEIGIKHYCFDPSLSPSGKSVIICMLRSNYGYWHRIYGRRIYDTEQDQVSDIVIDFLEKLYPGIRKDVEVIDEATPLSYERYTGSWKGATTGWLLTKETMMMMVQGMDKTLPGLSNFYLAGQWVEPGGSVPIVAMSGRNAIQTICHEDRRLFKTQLA